MKNIVLARIDDRLIHGQVVTAWLKSVKVQSILIIDDALSKNQVMQRIYKASAPSNVNVFIKNTVDALEFLLSNEGDMDVMILVKVPERLEELISQNVPIKKIVLGGMGSGKERKQFVKNVFASESEVACLKRLMEKGIEIVFQLVPDDKPMDLQKVIK